MEIRFLTAEDAGEWWRLRLEALKGDPEAFSSSAEEHKALTVEDVKPRLGRGAEDSFVVGAFEDARLCGMGGFYRENGLKSRHKGRVWGVYVTPAKRTAGIGRRILEMLIDRAAGVDGLEQILLSVTATQKSAIRLYQSLGFESFGCEPRALKIRDKFVDEEYMILRLKR